MHTNDENVTAHSLTSFTAGPRVELDASETLPFNDWKNIGPAPCVDRDGSPIYLGSAFFKDSVHPCKIGPHLEPPCRVPYGGKEVKHYGRYNLLLFDKGTMEWVPISHGHIPAHRLPVDGGYEEKGRLYHALAVVHGVKVPGKTGPHLGGCRVAYGKSEHHFKDGYEILCWKL